MRKRGRVDNAQAAIVTALRKIGASVAVTSALGAGFPDLVVGWRGRTVLMEVKTGAEKLTAAESDWWAKWAGGGRVVRSAEEAQMALIAEVGN